MGRSADGAIGVGGTKMKIHRAAAGSCSSRTTRVLEYRRDLRDRKDAVAISLREMKPARGGVEP